MEANTLRRAYFKSLGNLVPLGFRGGQSRTANSGNFGLIVSVRPAGTGCTIQFSLVPTRTGKPWEPLIATNGHTPRSTLWLLGNDGSRLSQEWTYPAAMFGNAVFSNLNPQTCYRLTATEVGEEPPVNGPAPIVAAAPESLPAIEPAAEPVTAAAKPARKSRTKKTVEDNTTAPTTPRTRRTKTPALEAATV